ncbi:MAG: YafY family protein [Actinomycetota bacterium]|nr:YafY family protein [Actinomycetota bacterium]
MAATSSARLLRLLSLLQSRPVWTAPELAERLGVTDRTIRRDVDRLRGLGYPVDAEVGAAGGYRLGRGGALPPLLLDDDEAVAVAVGLHAAARSGIEGAAETAVATLAKLGQVMPAHLAARVRAIGEVTDELMGRDTAPVPATVLLTVARACRSTERLELDYTDQGGRATNRRIDPLRLVRLGPRWYLVARDVDRGAWRSFRMDRVDAVRATGHLVGLVDPPEPVAFVRQGITTGPYALVATVRIPRPLAEAIEIVPRSVGRHEPDGDDATIVEIGGAHPEGMATYLASLAVPLEVLDPPEVRAALRAHAAELVGLNGPR